MREQPTDFQTLIDALVDAEVRFVIIGGLALVAQGSAHITQDIDIAYTRDAENLQALTSALAPFHPTLRGAPPGLPFKFDARTLRNGANFTFQTDVGRIDVLAHVPGIASFDKLWDCANVKNLYGHTVRVASLDALTAMKKAAGRTQDLRHLAEIEALKKLKQDGNA